MIKNYYNILDLEKAAPEAEIKKKFREMAFIYHPDVSKQKNAHQKFASINEAYQILSDPEKRSQYDLLYERYFENKPFQPQDMEIIVSTINHWARMARQKAKEDAEKRFREYAASHECYFNNDKKANGEPYFVYLHKTVSVRMSSITAQRVSFRNVKIPIPRSLYAQKAHQTGFWIKTAMLAGTFLLYKLTPIPSFSPSRQILFILSCLLLGGAICHTYYYFKHTKSIYYHARQHPLVKKYREKGYKMGSHVMYSTSPAGLVLFIKNLLF